MDRGFLSQNLTSSILLALSLGSFTAGCEYGPIAESGMKFTRGNVLYIGQLETSSQRTAHSLLVSVHGSFDPVPDALDDEFALHLGLALDNELLGDVKAGTVFDINGEKAYSILPFSGAGAGSGTLSLGAFSPSGGHAELVRDVSVTMECFCSPFGSEFTQNITGRLFVFESGDGVFRAALELRVVGVIPLGVLREDASIEVDIAAFF